jgi:hypothetical protein
VGSERPGQRDRAEPKTSQGFFVASRSYRQGARVCGARSPIGSTIFSGAPSPRTRHVPTSCHGTGGTDSLPCTLDFCLLHLSILCLLLFRRAARAEFVLLAEVEHQPVQPLAPDLIRCASNDSISRDCVEQQPEQTGSLFKLRSALHGFDLSLGIQAQYVGFSREWFLGGCGAPAEYTHSAGPLVIDYRIDRNRRCELAAAWSAGHHTTT